jgi:hypothetical protein
MSDACRHETEVLRAIGEDRWTDALRGHVRECEDCAAAIAVTPWMLQLSSKDARERPLPDPAIVWMKAQLLRGSAAVDRAARPLQVIQFVAYFVVAAGWAALLTWKWGSVQDWLRAFSPSHLIQSAATGGSLSATFFVAVLFLTSITIFLALHTILADE